MIDVLLAYGHRYYWYLIVVVSVAVMRHGRTLSTKKCASRTKRCQYASLTQTMAALGNILTGRDNV